MRVIKLSLVSACMAITALAIAGCGGDDNETTSATAASGTPTAGGQAVNISETEYQLDPSDPTLKSGTVSFKATNDGSVDHSLEVEGPNGEQELEQDLAPGQSGTLTVDLSQPGNYEFYCPIEDHRQRGMEGEITVTGAGGAAAGSGSQAGGTGTSAGGSSQTDDSGSSSGGGGGGYGY